MDYESIMAEIWALKSLLADTDYNDNKLIEGLVNAMKGATQANFVETFMVWLNSVLTQYGELCKERQAWRDRINELEAMIPVEEEELS